MSGDNRRRSYASGRLKRDVLRELIRAAMEAERTMILGLPVDPTKVAVAQERYAVARGRRLIHRGRRR